uniref:RING-type E3 ubiquitin transferase n=1 Tax=Ficedula albicollis TaxID=59894 RepID=A0A803VZ10_FICAL
MCWGWQTAGPSHLSHPDYICPRCESGFIEELPEEPSALLAKLASAGKSSMAMLSI